MLEDTLADASGAAACRTGVSAHKVARKLLAQHAAYEQLTEDVAAAQVAHA